MLDRLLDPVIGIGSTIGSSYSNWKLLSGLLQKRGWVVEGTNGDSKLVSVSQGGFIHCIDGRLGDKSEEKMKGVKIQGGVLGVMALGLRKGDEEAVYKAIEIIKQAGFIPSVHGDDHKQEAGCGFGSLWLGNRLSGLPKLDVSLARVREIVEAEGGAYVELEGEHTEKVLRINLVSGKTFVPDGTAFNLDVWAALHMGIDPTKLVQNAAEAVEKLEGDKNARIIY